ncbi:PIN domain-containing protein [Streptomyces sp. NPDC088246]|uniref:PIN domain-containing protein n=1 Tax=Streptomyces sp. NPDC088246 TaxID=3365842 RepID=UPI0037FB5676
MGGWVRSHPPSQVPCTHVRVTFRDLLASQRARVLAFSLADLLIASTAQRHGVTVLHYDEDYDRIAEITGHPRRWVVEPGLADRTE